MSSRGSPSASTVRWLQVPSELSHQAAVPASIKDLTLTIGGQRFPIRLGPPGIGADTGDLLADLGYTAAEAEALAADGVVVQG